MNHYKPASVVASTLHNWGYFWIHSFFFRKCKKYFTWHWQPDIAPQNSNNWRALKVRVIYESTIMTTAMNIQQRIAPDLHLLLLKFNTLTYCLTF